MDRKHPGFQPKAKHFHNALAFPKGFLWGTATSAHQVEGWNTNNDWWEWEQMPGTIANGQLSGRSTDHYHKFKEDIDILKKLNQNAHRFSIEWSRINPKKDKFDKTEVEHYIEVLKELKSNNIKTMVTLHHFTNPIWFAKMGGFETHKNLKYFQKYIEYIVPKIKDHVDFWVTINEPNIYTMMSYLLGLWPPGETKKITAYKVFDNLAHAHKQTYKFIHKVCNNPQVGVAQNVISYYTYDKDSILDWLSVRIADWFWNHWFIEKTKGFHDFLGINYYVHKRIKRIRLKHWGQFSTEDRGEGRERTDLDWEVFAPGLFDALVDMNQFNLPIYITENGISTLNDHRRCRYLISYLKELYHAIRSGVDVRGYFYWSLLDNFEWDKGLSSRFGFIDVNYQTLERKIRGSANLYAKICEENAINHDLLTFIGHNVDPKDVL